MKSLVRLLVVVLFAFGALVFVYACSSSSGGADGGAGGDSGKTLSCSSVCSAKATTCSVGASTSVGACQDFCDSDPSQATLKCVQSTSCANLLASFTSSKPLCPIVDAGDPDAEMGKLPGPPDHGDGSADGADGQSSDAKTGGDGSASDCKADDATVMDGSHGDSTVHDGGQDGGADGGTDANAGTCTISLSTGESYTCTALASYSPSSGTLMTLDSSQGQTVAGGGFLPYFEFGVTLSTSQDFMPGQSYSMPSGSAIHQEGEAVWIYSNMSGDGSAMVTVTSSGAHWTDDSGDGDIYYADAYGDATITLAPKDPPYATGVVTATIHWVTNGAKPTADGGMKDASHEDAQQDAHEDGSKDGNATSMPSCKVAVNSGAAVPCTSSMSFYSMEGFTVLTINPKSDGGDSTTISVEFPGQSSSLTSAGLTSSNCTNAQDCNTAVTVTSGSGASEKAWTRSWKASDEGSLTPWFDLKFTTFGICPPGGFAGIDPCNSFLASFTADSVASTSDAGALSVSVTGIVSGM